MSMIVRRCVYCGQHDAGIIFPCKDTKGHVWHGPADEKVEVTIEQLEHLLSTIRDKQYDVAIMWLMAAIRQAKQDVRERR
jgi:hypothetical protein